MSSKHTVLAAIEIQDEAEADVRLHHNGVINTKQNRTDVLIANADVTLCRTYEQMLAASGLRIVTAVNGLDCWMKIRTNSPDVLIVDVDLLWGGSAGVLALLREEPLAEAKSEVFVTGDDEPEVLSKRAGIKVERCFQKPLEMEMVLDSICDVFSNDPEISYSGEWK